MDSIRHRDGRQPTATRTANTGVAGPASAWPCRRRPTEVTSSVIPRTIACQKANHPACNSVQAGRLLLPDRGRAHLRRARTSASACTTIVHPPAIDSALL
jgi:hypothetical protein